MQERLVDLEKGGEAAEMVLGKPPKLLRSSIYLLAGLIAAGIVWAYFSVVDIVITAPGVVRPKGDLLKVQSLVSGRLLEVRVQEGEAVKEGDLLFRIDGKETETELEKALSRQEGGKKQVDALRSSRGTLVLQQQAELERDEVGLRTAFGELEKARRGQDQAAAGVREAEARVAEAQADYDRTKKLADEQVLSQAELQKKEAALKSAQASRDSAAASHRIAEQSVTLSEQGLELRGKQSAVSAEERKRALADLDSRIVALEEDGKGASLEAEKLRTALGHLEVRAPASGTVTSITTKNAGEVIRSGDPLALIAPEGAPWIVEAIVSNRDAGPLRQKIGGRVKLKIDAFPFRDFGTLEGRLLEVSPDATTHEKLGMVFKVQVGMDSLLLKRGRKEGKVGLGMTATVEIVREEERILLLLFKEVRDRVSYD